MTKTIGLRAKPAGTPATGEEWLRLDAAAPAASAFNAIASDRFAETDPFEVNTITFNSQEDLAIGSLQSGGFVAAWVSSQSVKAQLFDRHGEKVGTEFLVSGVGSSEPEVTGLAGGGFVVSWSDSDDSLIGVWARVFDASGNPVTGEFLVNTETMGTESQPSIAALTSGGFVIGWSETNGLNGSSDIEAQIFDASGAKVGSEFAVNAASNQNQYFPVLGALPGGGFVATWIDGFSGVSGQIFDSAGNKVGAEFLFAGNTGFYHALTVLSSGNFVIAMVDGAGDISGQIFSPAGAPIGDPFKLNTVTDDNHDMPTLTALPDGGFVASWRESTGTVNFFQDGEIKAQVFDADGVKIGDEFMVNDGTTGGQAIPKAAAFGSGDFIIGWQDFQGSFDSEIKARTYFSVETGTTGNDTFAGTSDRDFYRGLEGDDQIAGAGGDDELDGGSGADSMNGGAGDDIYRVDNGGDTVVEAAGEGFDRALTSVSFALEAGSEVEMLTTDDNFATSAINLTGNELSQYLYGNAGANEIDSGGGGDVMYGFGGDDRFYTRDAADRVVEFAGEGFDRVLAAASFTLEAGSEVEMFTTTDNLATTAINLTGNELSQYIYGNAGANEIDSGGGGDVMYGFEGDDRFYTHDAADRVVESAGGGFDRVLAGASFTLEAGSQVEMFTTDNNLSTAAINLTGNELFQYLYGNAGANEIDGGGGGDVMYGFEGDDRFYIRNVADRVVEFAAGGFDRVLAAASFTLEAGSEVEMFTTVDNLATTAINLTGNELVQYLYGNAGSNTLDGGGGGDVMYGFEGDDFFVIRNASDRAVEAAGGGSDRVFAGASFALEAGSEVEMLTTIDNLATTAINLTGNAIDQYLYGNAGANTLDGKGGSDVLTGFGGADNFAFTSALGGGNLDLFTDFVSGTDKILLDHNIFTGLPLGELSASMFSGSGAANDADDRIIFNPGLGFIFFDADGNGPGGGIAFALLQPGGVVIASDFVVI